MNNKKIFKSVYDYKFDKEKMRKKIIKKSSIKRGNDFSKYAIATCLAGIICVGIVISRSQANIAKLYNEENRNTSSYRNTTLWSNNSIEINIVNHVATTSILIDEKAVAIDLDEVDDLSDRLVIPKELNRLKSYVVYRKNSNTNEYDILNRNVYEYTSSSNKSIRITFKENIKDYHWPTDKKESIINGIKVIIDKYEDSYLTNFSVNDISYGIVTNGITIDELESLIISIIG